MKKPSVKIDWIVAENEEVWQASQSATPIEVVSSPRRRQTLALAILVTALLLLTGGWLWQQTVPAKAPPTNFSSIFVHEEHTLTHTIGLLDASVQVGSIQHLGDHVMARVIAYYPVDGKMRAYRETHFFEKSASILLRIPPDPTLMGPIRTLQIPHFTILYPAVDADAVYETASKLERLYAKLRADFGVPAVEANAVYTIEVAAGGTSSLFATSPSKRTIRIPARSSTGNTIEVSAGGEMALFVISASQRTISVLSPSTLSAPEEITAADLLYQAIVYPLAHLTLQESIAIRLDREQNYVTISPVQSALILWEFWDEGGPLTNGRDDIMRWVYKNSINESRQHTLPDGWRSICRAYHIWRATPWYTSIPLTCSQFDTSVLMPWPPPTLDTKWPQPTSQSGQYSNTEPPFHSTLTMVTIIDYIVATYGREKLPELATALVENPNKEQLIPTLFGCSVAEFEAGWQAYLTQHF